MNAMCRLLPACLLAFLAGCVTEPMPPSQNALTDTEAQKQVDALRDLMRTLEFPPIIERALKHDYALEPDTLRATREAWQSVAGHLHLRLLPETTKSKDQILLGSDGVLRVDPRVLQIPYVPRDRAAFDPNRFLGLFRNISVRQGYVLDYVYSASGGNGHPSLYARKAEAPPLPSQPLLEFLTATNAPSQDSYLSHVDALQADGGEQGWFQLALMFLVADQFYLAWHANYFDTRVICSPAGMNRFLSDSRNFIRGWSEKSFSLPADLQKAARALDVRPTVTVDAATATVRLTTFSNWGGFSRAQVVFRREAPHKVLQTSSEELVPYNCGVMF